MLRSVVTLACAAAVLAPMSAQAGEVHNRQVRQEHRIAQGIEGGSLSPREAARLQTQEAQLNAQRQRDLREGAPGLNQRQVLRLNREENHLSRRIYHTKHDGPNR